MSVPERPGHRLVVTVALIGMLLPLLATLLYSISGTWMDGLLPDNYTLKWYLELFESERFTISLLNSLAISIATLVITTMLTIPTVFVVYHYYPSLKGLMNLLILLPFAIPPIVSSVGLLQLYSKEPIILTGTPWILIGANFTVALPFMYRAIANSMNAMNLEDMTEAAHLLGASTWQIFFYIVVPNARKGLIVALFLCFSLLIGEFVFANLLAGTQYETVQVYLFNVRHKSGHYSSAIVISYFIMMLVMTMLAIKWGSRK